MLSHSNQPPPNTFRDRFQQYRRRHSISQKAPPVGQRRLQARRSLDLPRPQNSQTHDEPVPQIPQAIADEHHRGRQQLSRRQSQPARNSHGPRNPGPSGLGQPAQGASYDWQPDHIPPNTAQGRSQIPDYRSKTNSAASQHVGLAVQRRAISAQSDTIGNASVTPAASVPLGTSGGGSGREAPFIAATL